MLVGETGELVGATRAVGVGQRLVRPDGERLDLKAGVCCAKAGLLSSSRAMPHAARSLPIQALSLLPRLSPSNGFANKTGGPESGVIILRFQRIA